METRGSYLRRLEELKKREREIQKAPPAKPYDPSKMDVEHMPFGCWVILGIIVVVILGLAGVIKIFH